jgi:TRAP-type C4-dicarboxylate transport system permease small subunit
MKQAIDKFLEIILIVLVALMTINVLWQVASRYITSNPSSVTEELARFLLVWLGLLGGAYVSGKQKHLAIDLLLTKMRGAKKMYFNIVIQVLIVAFAAFVLIVGGSRMVYVTLVLGQKTAALQIPMAFVYGAIPVSGLLIMYYAIHQITVLLKEKNESI